MRKLGIGFASVVLAWVSGSWIAGCSSEGGGGDGGTSNGTGGTTSASGTDSSATGTPTGGTLTGGTLTGGTLTGGTLTGGTVTGGTPTNGSATGSTVTGGTVTGSTSGTGGATGATTTNAATTDATSTTGSEVVPEPSLITSGMGAYWQVGEVTVGGSSATITVNSSQTFQDWHGWGGTFNEKGWAALQALSEADRTLAINLLFSVTDGLGLDWGRIPIGPSDYAVERYHLSSGPGQFSVDHDLQYLIPYIKAAQAVKGDVKYWASPWTPPPWAKSGNTENSGYDKGYFNTEHYQAYADFFVAWIQAYEAQGIPIDHVMPQNEPGWAQSYPTCAFGPARDSTNSMDLPNPVTLGTFVDGYLFPALDAAGLGTNVWFGTLSNNSFFPDYFNDMMGKASWSRIVGIGLQWETQASISTALGSGKLVMQSEHKCGNYPWLGQMATSPADANRENFLSSMAPNNHAYGEESWDLIKSWLEDGVHIYSAWNMVLDTGGFNLDEVRPWPQNALLAVDTGAGSLQITPYYYVFRHVAQYVDAGGVRIGVTGGNALAFKNPDNSIVTIMFNEGQSPSQTTLSIDGTLVQFEIPARGWATVNWQG